MSHRKFASIKKLTVIWVILVILTLITATIGYYQLSGLYIVGVILLTVVVKGQLIVDHYMGLRHVRGFWRLAMLGFIIIIPAIIFAGYYFSMV